MDMRNIAIIAHVDHGKTTLVDELLKQSGIYRDNETTTERAMDSNDLERERGITIFAKPTSVEWKGTRINIVDTPGHADFGGEVERILSMVDGVILLVDAAEGPMPQTKFVTSKALALGLRPIVVVNKVDKPDGEPDRALDECFDLFANLEASDEQLDFPSMYASGRSGWADMDLDGPRKDLKAMFDLILHHVPPPAQVDRRDEKFSMLATTLGGDPFLGRLLTGRVETGRLKAGETIKSMSRDGELIESFRVTKIMAFRGLSQSAIEEAEAGDIVSIAGMSKATVADTLSDLSINEAIPAQPIDPPTITVTFGINDSPLAGRDGKKVQSRVIRDRLLKEAESNVAIKVSDTPGGEAFEVAGRGELQLAVLIENMRREGFELQVGRPEVITKEIKGKKHEPLESGTCDVPDEHVGTITQALAPRKGRVTDLRPGDPGRTIVSFEAPSRGLIGFRSMLMSSTRGTALLHQTHAGWTAWVGELPHRMGGAMIADRIGSTTGYALDNLQLRGELFVEPGVEVYEGMIIGESARGDEMVVNCVRAKEKTNIRTHSHDDGPKLAAPVVHTLETAIEWIGDDELVEVTPKNIRIRKRGLALEDRRRAAKKG